MADINTFVNYDLNTWNTWPVIFFLIIVTFIAVKIVKIFSRPESPKLAYCQNRKNPLVDELILQCPQILTPYKPPLLWGRNGHIQTVIYGVLGHASLRRGSDRRHFTVLPDGSTVTFDIFDPWNDCGKGDFTLALCPGIANHSESNYIRSCVNHAQEAGYRCAVLNHLGALKDVKLTSPRIFTYGGTEEYGAMMNKLTKLYPTSKFISIGFSMGANIVTKYLGESTAINDKILFGMSVGQGYDLTKTNVILHNWENGRRAYLAFMTENVKNILRNHYDDVIVPHVRTKLIETEQVFWSATSLYTIDDCFTRKLKGYSTMDEYLKAGSCVFSIPNIKVPMIFVNASDDPFTPQALLDPVIKICEDKPGFLFIQTKHGGHLGFIEGSSFRPNGVRWLDRLIVQISDGMINLHS